MKKRAAELSFHSNLAISMVLILMAMLFLLLVVIVTLHHDRNEEEQKELSVLAARASGKLGRILTLRMASIESLARLVERESGSANGFEPLASVLLAGNPVVRSAFLAPDGVVAHVYPPVGGLNAIGDLCFASDDACSLRAVRTGKPSLDGPFEPATGGRILSARVPVYIEGTLWGVVGAELDFDAVFDPVFLDDPGESGFTYRVWPAKKVRREHKLLWASSGEATHTVAKERFSGFNLDWYVEASPKRRPDEIMRNRLYLAGLALVCLLVAALGYHYLNLRGIKAVLEDQAMTDNLTGLPNRRNVMAFLETMIAEARKSGGSFVVLFMDLNNFKEVNDIHGHKVGDDVLRKTASILRDNAADLGHIGRIGGDEFVVLLDEMDVGNRLDRIIEALSMRLRVTVTGKGVRPGKPVEVSASFGVASYPKNGDDAPSLLHAADLEMYQNKKRLKGTTRVGPFKKNFRW